MPAVLFDLDGTLVDSVPDLGAALNQMLRERGEDVNQRRRVSVRHGPLRPRRHAPSRT